MAQVERPRIASMRDQVKQLMADWTRVSGDGCPIGPTAESVVDSISFRQIAVACQDEIPGVQELEMRFAGMDGEGSGVGPDIIRTAEFHACAVRYCGDLVGILQKIEPDFKAGMVTARSIFGPGSKRFEQWWGQFRRQHGFF